MTLNVGATSNCFSYCPPAVLLFGMNELLKPNLILIGIVITLTLSVSSSDYSSIELIYILNGYIVLVSRLCASDSDWLSFSVISGISGRLHSSYTMRIWGFYDSVSVDLNKLRSVVCIDVLLQSVWSNDGLSNVFRSSRITCSIT